MKDRVNNAGSSSPKYQLIDTEGWEATNAPTRLEEWQKLGVDYAMHLPNPDSLLVNPQGEWNSSRIVCDNGHVEPWLNGRKILEFEAWTDDWFARQNSGKLCVPKSRKSAIQQFPLRHTLVKRRRLRLSIRAL